MIADVINLIAEAQSLLTPDGTVTTAPPKAALWRLIDAAGLLALHLPENEHTHGLSEFTCRGFKLLCRARSTERRFNLKDARPS